MSRDANRPRLGRGLSSLIRNSFADTEAGQYQPAPKEHTPPAVTAVAIATPESVPAVATAALEPTAQAAAGLPAPHSKPSGPWLRLPLAALRANPYQPRRDFDQASLAELADSIRVHGVVEPIVVCPSNDGSGGHFVVAGERRLRAAQLAGLSEVPCIYREVTRQEMLELALVENIHREDLNPMERATALRDMMDRFALTQQQVAERVGQPRATVANYLRLLDLCTEVQEMVRQGSLSLGHAKVLAGLAGQVGPQLALAGRCVSENLPVRQLEELVRQAQTGQAVQPQPPAQERRQRPPYLLDVERQLTQVVGTKVAIKPGRAKHTGRIVIDYYSLEDFDRITAALGVSIES